MQTAPLLRLALACCLGILPVTARASDGWPRTFTADGTAFTVYQPQVTAWEGNTLTCRAAVSVLPTGSAAPKFGTVNLSGMTSVDNVAQTVSLSNITVAESNFPANPDQAQAFGSLIAAQAGQWAQNLSLPAVKANLAVTTAEGAGSKTVAVQNPVPVIYFSQQPAILILVDGNPALRPVAGSPLLRVINTQALIAMDPSSGTYYLRANNIWFQGQAVEGPWTAAGSPPDALDAMLQAVASTPGLQLFNPADGSQPANPAIYVSTVPAELIITTGAPQFEPVPGTQLLHVTNSGSSIFMNSANQSYYVAISGRWFTGASLNGPWQFVPANQLPPDFANIPETAPAGTVLASVAGTPQASEAAISARIPQTASISRNASTTVTYDGAPQFLPIKGTDLMYAVNTATPVISAEGKFYAVVNGVWFKADAPTGPWKVADKVPDAIYTIPPESPVFYATNVYVYGSTPDVVYVGYTPGYFGPVVAPEGVVVFGTGFAYPPYIGDGIWIAPPLTYGFGAGFACGLATGFAFGVAFDHGWGCAPAWGPWHGGWGNDNVTINRNWNNVNVNRTNIYNRWGDNNTVHNTDISRNSVNAGNLSNDRTEIQNRINNDRTPDRNDLRNDASRLGDNNVFAGNDGKAYRAADDGGWQRNDGSDWKDVDRDSFSGATRDDLDSQRFSRSMGDFRGVDSGGFRGGGFRGGGGFRR